MVDRFDLGPLEDWMRAQCADDDERPEDWLSERRIAELVGGGCHELDVYHWRRRGVCWWVADELAVRFGAHPATIWHDWFGDDAGEAQTGTPPSAALASIDS